ncbi:mCG145378, partial [Mus musculus]
QWASSPAAGSLSAFGSLSRPQLYHGGYLLTINIETCLFPWVYSPSFVYSLIPPNCSPCEESRWNSGSLASHPGLYKGPRTTGCMGDPIKTFAKC